MARIQTSNGFSAVMTLELSFSGFEITPEQYVRAFKKEDLPFFLDVREPWEVALVSLPQAHCIPLSLLEENAETLPQDRWIVVYCHHGVRSLNACHLLRHKGFDKVISLKGGIHRWALVIDPTLRRY